MSRIFQLPRQVPLVSGAVSPGAKANFFLTLTTTPTDTYQDAALTTPHMNPVVADAAGVFATIYLDPDVVYKLTLDDTNDALIYTEDPIQDALTQENIGLIFYPRSAAEISAGITPTNFFEIYGNVLRYGTNTTPGTTDLTTAIQAALDTHGAILPDEDVAFDSTLTLPPVGTYISGQGNNSILTYTGTGTAMSMTRNVANDSSNAIFENFRYRSSTAAIGLHLVNTYTVTIQDVFGWGNGKVGFTDCFIKIEGTTGKNAANIKIIGGSYQSAAGDGIKFVSAAGAGPGRCLIQGNRIQGNSGTGVVALDNVTTEISILDNVIEGNTTREIDISEPWAARIKGNHIEHVDATNPPVRLGNPGPIAATTFCNNNVAGGGATHCVEITAATLQGSRIVNNVFAGYTVAPITTQVALTYSFIGENRSDDISPSSIGDTFAVTALAGGGQASATQLAHEISRIGTCATSGDSVKLPIGRQGMRILILNQGAASCDVFPQTGATIDDLGINTAKALAVNSTLMCVSFGPSDWETFTLAR